MAAGFYGEIVIRFVADTAPLSKGLTSAATQTEAAGQTIANTAKKSGQHWERAGLAMQNIGRTMTQFVSLPVAAGFAVATVAGYRYEKTLLKLKNLTGLTAAQTVKYGEAMKELGPKVGVGPQALAEAMYYVSSSGFKAQEALKLVTVAAKASAAGMGDTQVITDALTSAINSYGHENLSAARAVDIMMKTIQVGKAEPEALATSLGRIMPVASQLGVEFNQLGGMIAGLTLGGLSAAEAVTSLRGSMFALVAPGKQAKEEMEKYGLSVRQIKRIVRDEGLLEALQLMYEKTGGNELAMKRMIPNVRALNGVMSMLGENYGNTRRTIDEVTKSQGKLNEAFAATSKTDVFKMDQAIAKIKAAFTDIGQKLLPVVARILEDIVAIVDKFSELSPTTQEWILKLSVAAAALGPISMVLGSMVRSAALLNAAFSVSGGFLGALKGAGAVNMGTMGIPGLLAGIKSIPAAISGAKAALMGLASGGIGPLLKGLAMMQISGVAAFGAIGVAAGLLLWKLKSIADETNAIYDEVEQRAQANVAAELAVKVKQNAVGAAQALQDVYKGMAAGTMSFRQAREAVVAWHDRLLGALAVAKRMGDAEMVGRIKELIRQAKLLAGQDWIPKAKTQAQIDTFVNSWLKLDKLKIPRLDFSSTVASIKTVAGKIDDYKLRLAALKSIKNPSHAVKLEIKQAEAAIKKYEQLMDKLEERKIKLKGQMDGAAFAKAAKNARESGQKLRDAVVKPLEESASEASSAGSNAGMSYVMSLASWAPQAEAAGFEVGAAGARGINAGQDSESPSKKAMQSGIWLVEGYAIGVKKGTAKAIAAAAEMSGNIVSILDAALQVNLDVKGFEEQGMPTATIAKKWAAKIAKLMKTIYTAIQKELKGLDLLDKESGDKTIPGRGTKFSALATLAGDIGSIFSAFADMSTETATKSVEVLSYVRSKAKLIGQNVVAMARAMMDAMKGLLISEFTGGNISRAVQVVSDLAGIISTFAEITKTKVDAADAGLWATFNDIKRLAPMIRAIADGIKDAFSDAKVDEVVAGAAGEAVQLASDLAGIITTFAELTQEKIDLAIVGMKTLLFGGKGVVNIARFGSYLRQIADALKTAFALASEDLVVSGAAKEAMDLATQIAGVITTFAEMTEKTVVAAKAGFVRVIEYAPELGRKLEELVKAIAGSFKVISDNKDFDPASKIAGGVASFVSDVTGIVSSLAGTMTGGEDVMGEDNKPTGEKTPLVSLVDKARLGAIAVTNAVGGPEGLGQALTKMVEAFTTALGVLNITDLTKLGDALTKLNEIAGAIGGIVDSLSDLTTDKVDLATGAGKALGGGFYNGLLEQYNKIMDLARRIPTDAAALIANPSLVLAPITKLASGGIVTRPTLALVGERGPEAVVPLDRAGGMGDTYKVNVYIDKLLARDEREGRQSVNAISNAVIHKLATARRATGRSLA